MDSGFWTARGPYRRPAAQYMYTVIQQKQHIKVTTLCLSVTRQGRGRGGGGWMWLERNACMLPLLQFNKPWAYLIQIRVY